MKYLSLVVVVLVISSINALTVNRYTYPALNCPAANALAPVPLVSGACVSSPPSASERITVISSTQANSCAWTSTSQCTGQGNCVTITNGECMNGVDEAYSVMYSWSRASTLAPSLTLSALGLFAVSVVLLA